MPYFINTFRIPKPGKFTAVAKGTEESLKATGKFGFVSIPVAPRMPTAQSLAVVGTVTGFETLDDVDVFVDALVADDLAGFAPLHSPFFRNLRSSGRRGCVVLPDDAARYTGLPRRADPRRVPRRILRAQADDSDALRNRRGVREQVAVPALRRAGPDHLLASRLSIAARSATTPLRRPFSLIDENASIRLQWTSRQRKYG